MQNGTNFYFFDGRVALGEWGGTVQRAQQQWACPDGRGASRFTLRNCFLCQDLGCIPAAVGLAHIPGLALLSGQFCELGALVPGTVPIDFLSA